MHCGKSDLKAWPPSRSPNSVDSASRSTEFAVVRPGQNEEFGVRLALGATPGSLTQLSLHHGLKLALIGLGLGLLAAYPAVRMLEQAVAPAAIGAAAAVMLAAAGAACYAPARRAAKLDPATVLRHD